jgi:serine phosphatase RsbU (regulator of sigma subunit)
MKKITFYFCLLFLLGYCEKGFTRDKKLDVLLYNDNTSLSSKVDSAITYCDSIINTFSKDNHALADAYRIKAHAFYLKGNYPQTLSNLQKSLSLSEQGKYNDILLPVYNLYGTFYKKQNDFNKALDQFIKANKLANAIKDSSAIASSLNDIGTVYQRKNKPDSAVKNYTEALQIYERLKNKVGASYSLDYLSEMYAGQNKFDTAIAYLNRSLMLRSELNDTTLIAMTYVNLGEVYLQIGNKETALQYFFQCAELAQKIKYADLLRHCYKMISDIYFQQKNFEKAYEYYNLHVLVKDSIYNENNLHIVQELEAKYQNEKKQLQIDNLNKENELNQVKIEKQAINTRLLILGSILLFIIVVIILFAYRNKRKANEIISLQKKQVEIQKDLVETKSKEITDSIYYAQRIQKVLLANDAFLQNSLPEYFVLYKPKDIVSGDFYWANIVENKFYLCVGDCTGHGVPGAFMSLLNITFLNEAVTEKKIDSPDKIIEHVRTQIITSLNPEGTTIESWDGMDAVLCMFDFKGMWLRFVCANNPLWLIRNKELKEFAADKMPVGKHHGETMPYKLNTLGLRKGDIIYAFTDGYADQFGGKDGKKFKYKKLQALLLENCDRSMEEQKEILDRTIEQWRNTLEQVDDILIFGIKV